MSQHNGTEYTATFEIPKDYPKQGPVYLFCKLSTSQDYHDPDNPKFLGIFDGIKKLANDCFKLNRKIVVLFELTDTLDRYNHLIYSINTTSPDEKQKLNFIETKLGQAYQTASKLGDERTAKLTQLIAEHFNGYTNIELYQDNTPSKHPDIRRWDSHVFNTEDGKITTEHANQRKVLQKKLEEDTLYNSTVSFAVDKSVKLQLDWLSSEKKLNPNFEYYYNSELTHHYVREYILEESAVMLQWDKEAEQKNIVWAMCYPYKQSPINEEVFACLPTTQHLLLTNIDIKKTSVTKTASPVKQYSDSKSSKKILSKETTKPQSQRTQQQTANNEIDNSPELQLFISIYTQVTVQHPYLLVLYPQLIQVIQEGLRKNKENANSRNPKFEVTEAQLQLMHLLTKFQQQNQLLAKPTEKNEADAQKTLEQYNNLFQ